MKTIVTIAATAAVITFGVARAAPLPEINPDDVGFSKLGLVRLDDFFAREIAAKRVPGAVVAVARDGKLVHYKAYGMLDPDKGTPMSVDAIFALASMTKPMAAVAGLTLMEQGKLPLQAKLSDYYPGFADMKVGVTQADGSLKLDPQASPIFIHDLYLSSQVEVARFNPITGVLAALPMLLIYLQVTWTVILVGAEVSYAIQNVHSLHAPEKVPPATFSTHERLSLLMVDEVCRRHRRGDRVAHRRLLGGADRTIGSPQVPARPSRPICRP